MRSGRLIVAGGLVGAALALYGLSHDPPLDQSCPSGDRTVAAAEVHLAPSVIRHQNWIGVDPSQAGHRKMWVYACANGLVVGRRTTDALDVDPGTGLAKIKVATRWVDFTWLTGELDGFRDPGKWTVVYAPVDVQDETAAS